MQRNGSAPVCVCVRVHLIQINTVSGHHSVGTALASGLEARQPAAPSWDQRRPFLGPTTVRARGTLSDSYCTSLGSVHHLPLKHPPLPRERGSGEANTPR